MKFYPITFREAEKSLPCVKGGGTACRDGGIVKKQNVSQNNPSAAFGVSSLYTRELFYVHLWDVNFPDKHCICGHKYKIRHTSFEICRVFENCPLGYDSKDLLFLCLVLKMTTEVNQPHLFTRYPRQLQIWRCKLERQIVNQWLRENCCKKQSGTDKLHEKSRFCKSITAQSNRSSDRKGGQPQSESHPKA